MCAMARVRTRQINVYLSEEEYTRLQSITTRSKRSTSEVIRKMIMGYQLKEQPSEELKEFNRQLLLIGTNLNQIATKANAYNYIDVPFYREQAEALNELRLKLYERFLIPEKVAEG